MSSAEKPTHARPVVTPSVAGRVFPAGARSLVSPAFAGALCALAAAVGLSILAQRVSPTARLSNQDLTRTAFGDTYLLIDAAQEGRAYLLRRRDATVRRADAELPGRPWSWSRLGKPGDPGHWLLSSEAGRVWLVPAASVPDWSYPFLFSFVAREDPAAGLPDVRWTQLFVDRQYRGLYLSVEWGGGGGELLLAGEGGAATVSLELGNGEAYERLLAAGVLPQLEPPSELLAWLAARQPAGETVLFLPDREPFALRVVPVPIAPGELVALRSDVDLRWRSDLVLPEGLVAARSGSASLDAATRRRIEADLPPYGRSLQAALDAQARVFGGAPFADLASRQEATSELGFRLDGPDA
ncbi:MAG: hypothetical protein R3190_00180 [Thermoanaerobaculia bacterium]|nr:hypothetical protein [Thermoanaerobaculia bacterium]